MKVVSTGKLWTGFYLLIALLIPVTGHAAGFWDLGMYDGLIVLLLTLFAAYLVGSDKAGKIEQGNLLSWIKERVTGWETMSESEMRAALSDIEDELAAEELLNSQGKRAIRTNNERSSGVSRG